MATPSQRTTPTLSAASAAPAHQAEAASQKSNICVIRRMCPLTASISDILLWRKGFICFSIEPRNLRSCYAELMKGGF